MPYSPHSSSLADVPHTKWGGTRKDAEALADRIGGDLGVVLGPVMGEDFSLGGLDLDTCRDPETGKVEKWAREIVERFDTYSEISPSETGVKVFFTYTDRPADLPRANLNTGKDHPPAIDHYSSRANGCTEHRRSGGF